MSAVLSTSLANAAQTRGKCLSHRWAGMAALTSTNCQVTARCSGNSGSYGDVLVNFVFIPTVDTDG